MLINLRVPFVAYCLIYLSRLARLAGCQRLAARLFLTALQKTPTARVQVWRALAERVWVGRVKADE